MKKIILLYLSLILSNCASKPEHRAPAQVTDAGGMADWAQQMDAEDKVRRSQSRTEATRRDNLKKGFPISLKMFPDTDIKIYQSACFERIVEEFLDYLPRTRVINENPNKNITVTELRGWTDANVYFNYSVTDINNMSYKGHVYVKSGIRVDKDIKYFECKAVPGARKFPSIEMKSSDEQIYPVK